MLIKSQKEKIEHNLYDLPMGQ